MKESEKKILKHFAVKAQRECGLRSRKKHVPMTRMILLECSTSDKIESIDDVKYVMFEDCKDGQQYQCRKENGHYSVEKVEKKWKSNLRATDRWWNKKIVGYKSE